ncbi:unnamed protein product, partial [Phaeothamnion confervicola]
LRTLLIDNYDSYTYNLFQQLAVVNGVPPLVAFNDACGGSWERLLERMGGPVDNIVLSPGPGRPERAADFGVCRAALLQEPDIPILGVCLGHEGLAHVHGARVVHAPEPMHGRRSRVFHDGGSLFRGVTQGFEVVRYHSLVVDPASLPAMLVPTAWTPDGILMGLRHRDRPHWGVQFHPESIGTHHGTVIIGNFRDVTVQWRAGRGNKRRRTDAVVDSQQPSLPPLPLVSPAALPPRQIPSIWLHVGELGSAAPAPKEPAAADREALPVNNSASNLALLVAEATGLQEERLDSEAVFRALFSRQRTAWWLDSSNCGNFSAGSGGSGSGGGIGSQARARFSFMGAADGPLAETIEYYAAGDAKSGGISRRLLRTGADGVRRDVRTRLLPLLRDELEAGRPHVRLVGKRSVAGDAIENFAGGGAAESAADDGAALPFSFLGGYVGFFGYEMRHDTAEALAAVGVHDAMEGAAAMAATRAVAAGPTDSGVNAPNGALHSSTNSATNGATKGVAKRVMNGVVNGAEDREGQGQPDVPTAFWVFADRFVAFDHQEGRVYAVALAKAGSDDALDAARAWALDAANRAGSAMAAAAAAAATATTTTSKAAAMATMAARSVPSPAATPATPAPAAPRWADRDAATWRTNRPRAAYEENLRDILTEIRNGETYEVCLTNQLLCESPPPGGALELYSRLRRCNPAPYAAFLLHDPAGRLANTAATAAEAATAAGTTSGVDAVAALNGAAASMPAFAVCCSSPERFLRVEEGGWVESKPIKGTVRRGMTPVEDAALAASLTASEKTVAENLMIVDLVRNDL